MTDDTAHRGDEASAAISGEPEPTGAPGVMLAVWRLVLVAALAVLLGYAACRVYLFPPAQDHALHFSRGHWISPAAAGPAAYYRGEVYGPDRVLDAWVQVAATDSYEFYINGRRVGANTRPLGYALGVHDIAPMLQPGRNVIAVYVARRSYPGDCRLAVDGGCTDARGRETRFGSDPSWKALAQRAPAEGEELEWHSPELDAAEWPSVKAGPTPAAAELLWPGPVDPDAFTSAPAGQWLRHPVLGVKDYVLATSFTLTGHPRGGWLRVAAVAPYDLVVNQAVLARNRLSSHLDVYDLTGCLRRGANTVHVAVHGDQSEARLLVDGQAVTRDGRSVRMASSSAWTVADPPSAGTGAARLAATAVGRYYEFPYRPLTRELRPAPASTMDLAVRAATEAGVMLAIALAVLLAASLLRAQLVRGSGVPTAAAWELVLAPLALAIIFLLFVVLLQFDARWPAGRLFRPSVVWIPVAWCAAAWCAILLRYRRRGWDGAAGALEWPARVRALRAPLVTGTLLALCVVGLALRLHGLGDKSLTHDEVSMVQGAQGVLDTGYPSKYVGTMRRLSATYELPPYLIAVAAALGGLDEEYLRLPAVFLGGAMILLIGYVGMRLWGVAVGLLAAAIYALSTWAVLWSQNLFYPQQLQLVSLASAYVFYQAVCGPAIIPKRVCAAVALMAVTYLSWEGSGFLIPALVIGMIAARGRDLTWLRSRALWVSAALLAALAIVHESFRMLINYPYLMMGQGLASVSAPSAVFLGPDYDATFYVRAFLWKENQPVQTLLALCGLPLAWRNRALRYCYAVLASLLVLYTGFLPNYSARYAYMFQPYLVLPAAAVAVQLGLWLGSWRPGRHVWAWRGAAAVGLAGLLLLSSNSLVLRFWSLGSNPDQPDPFMRLGLQQIDYRGATEFVRARLQPGDQVVSLMPHTTRYYLGQSDYFAESCLVKMLFLDPRGGQPEYLSILDGVPALRSAKEVQDVFERNRRVWVIAGADYFLGAFNSDEVVQYISANCPVVYESYQVRVFLWNRGNGGP